jgi:threonine/homoserine/homoserine lactone efflux protein
MDIAGLLVFAGIYALAVATPGPGIAAIVARGLARGAGGSVPFIAGFVVGDLVWFLVAALGLAIVAQTFTLLFTIIKYAGCAYLLYLAWKIWTAPVKTIEVDESTGRAEGLQAFLGSFALTLGNPKVAMFFLSVMPLVVDMTALSPLVFAELALVIVFVITPVLSAYAILAIRARRLFRSEKALKTVNRVTAVTMAGVAGAIATR